MRLAALAALAFAWPALAQDRPREADLFGAPPPADAAPAPSAAADPAAPADDSRTAPEPGAERRLGETLARTRDTLDVGGQLYLRAFAFSRKGDPPSAWDLTAPSLLDLYLDARPSDRVRAFVLARMRHDPTAEESAGGVAAADASQPSPIPGLRPSRKTEVALDQLWLRFDAGRRVFFTAGKQHVKWGVGRFWNPTDFLHAVRRDPLAPFDARTGTTMLRLQVPWESRGWSLQAATILEPLLPPSAGATPRSGQLGALGAAARVEAVLGGAEVGLGGVVQRGRPSRLGVDASAGIWELDVYGELALRSAPELPLWREVSSDPAVPLLARFARRDGSGANPAATIGASWTAKYGADETLTVGAEAFWNRNGYGDRRIYPWLLVQEAFTPFYVGRRYAGAFLYAPAPGRWDAASFTLSALGNLSDRSWLGRLDFALVVLTHLRLEAFLAVHAGAEGGELRLALDVPPQDLGGGAVTPRVRVGAPLADAGVALRVAL